MDMIYVVTTYIIDDIFSSNILNKNVYLSKILMNHLDLIIYLSLTQDIIII